MKRKGIYYIEPALPLVIAADAVVTAMFGHMLYRLYQTGEVGNFHGSPMQLLLVYLGAEVMVLIYIIRSAVFIYRRNRCLELGQTYEGEIIGKKTVYGRRRREKYYLWVVYGDRVFMTPKLSKLGALRIGSMGCTVHEHQGFVYVDGIDFTGNGIGTDIRMLEEIRKMKSGDT